MFKYLAVAGLTAAVLNSCGEHARFVGSFIVLLAGIPGLIGIWIEATRSDDE